MFIRKIVSRDDSDQVQGGNKDNHLNVEKSACIQTGVIRLPISEGSNNVNKCMIILTDFPCSTVVHCLGW